MLARSQDDRRPSVKSIDLKCWKRRLIKPIDPIGKFVESSIIYIYDTEKIRDWHAAADLNAIVWVQKIKAVLT
jgi:dihydropteroate synthase